jgi:hypothetical protein
MDGGGEARVLRLPRLYVNQRPVRVNVTTAGGIREGVAPWDFLLWPVYDRGRVYRCFK